MFGGGGGCGILSPTVLTLGVLVGGMSPRPRVVEGRLEVRDVVDGAPATRFGADLRRLIETAALLGEA